MASIGRSTPRAVHPRSRGEHISPAFSPLPSTGSSPLARGTLGGDDAAVVGRRFIPARAGNTGGCSAAPAPFSVHPRSRGEHHTVHGVPDPLAGSSPLARGTREVVGVAVQAGRFIPARAGNTPGTWRIPPPRPVHPRSRGEHVERSWRTRWTRGSSPLARGTRRSAPRRARRRRFIPARAGNTGTGIGSGGTRTVHPRSRGEHDTVPEISRTKPGSSPLARGTRRRRGRHGGVRRFIPARAGNTTECGARRPVPTVHPRSRGEHINEDEFRAYFNGSSPLARGTRTPERTAGVDHRFIPARAGNTWRIRANSTARAVHPRSRGEHRSRERLIHRPTGSSPLARGTLRLRRADPVRERFIPARAGNTTRPGRGVGRHPVHPRSRGEHGFVVPTGKMPSGSSPLARGTRCARRRARARGRFIPARAGNTRGW